MSRQDIYFTKENSRFLMRLSGVLIRPSEQIFHQKNPMGALDLKNMPSTAIYNTPRGEALRDEPTETTPPPPTP